MFNMLQILFLLYFVPFIFGDNENRSVNASFSNGRTYFFKYNQSTNQFRVYNRINSNDNNTSINHVYPHHFPPSTSSDMSPRMNELRKSKPFLDDEWNYSSSSQIKNRSNIPPQIHKLLYESARKETGNKTISQDITTRVLFNQKVEDSVILRFKSDKIKGNQTIDNVELHFYWIVQNDSDIYKNAAVLRLYQIDSENSKTLSESSLIQNPDIHKLLNVIYISKAQTGWQAFKMKKTLENWVNYNENLEFLITVSQSNQHNISSVFNDTQHNDIFRTFLILHLKEEEDEQEHNDTIPSLHGAMSSRLSCSRKEMYVDFNKLNWNNFILAPDGFMAYDCNGRCTHNGHSTNHIKILNAFQEVDRKLRSPCCVPTKYHSLPIMFYNQHGDVIIKVYKDMIAAECGCR